MAARATMLALAAGLALTGAARARHEHLVPTPYPDLLEPQDQPSLPEGVEITVYKPGPAPARGGAPLDRQVEAGRALAACWSPPATFAGARWLEMSVRVSLKRDGSINGVPRVTFSRAPTDASKRAGARDLLAALAACSPLPLTPGLGAAIAGQPFNIRFIEKDDT